MKPICAGFLFLAAMLGQPSSGGPKFEVAAIRPSVPAPPVAGVGARSGGGGGGAGGGCPQRLKIDSSRVDIGCATPIMLIGYAYRFPSDRITVPPWMVGPGAGRFDIAATIPAGVPADRVPEMMKALLADRFGLVLHRGTSVQPIYALVVAKGGLKLGRAAVAADTESGAASGTTAFAGEIIERMGEIDTIGSLKMGTVRITEKPELAERMDAPAISPEGIAQLLERMMPVETPVIDMTGLNGRYRLVIDVSLNGLPKLTPGSIGDSTAMTGWRADREEEILKRFNDGLRKSGLQLERRKGPVESLVVDRLDRSPSGN